ncbi:DNA-protecting protein DprA [Phytoactinopolyspora sp. XMNu-373]|uniref:DNA-protecting protein DprA n=1 Tax=Phytoactinopolyspora mesophila TaxID=2650750 RepID=A0A7K3M8N0_9ACTN|nr:DNA-protecting protein DprA [Phytoactinopolyspora mesophila]
MSAVAEPGSLKVAQRVANGGAEATWNAIIQGDARFDRDGVLGRRAEGVDGAGVLSRAAELEIRFVCPGDADWPTVLDTMPATLDAGAEAVPPPFGLWVRGRGSPAGIGPQAVAVVGARAATSYGVRVAADLAADLATLGWTVVSGAAYGIDAAAHRGAMAMAGPTHAVLACGLDIAYPRAHAELLERIAGCGVVISELPPGMKPMRSRFIARNRIIAGLTSGTVVVEAALRSGALSTAHWAVKLGREVMVVPGPVTSQQSAGCHEWARNKGATLVTDAAEVVDAAGRLGVDAVSAPVGENRPLDRFRPEERDVYERMPAYAPVTVSELAECSGYSVPFVEASLRKLAGGGLVAEHDDGWARVPLAV